MDDLSYLLKAIKLLNPKIKFVIDIDQNYFSLYKENSISRKHTTESLKLLESNLSLMDRVLTPTVSFTSFLQRFLAHRCANSKVSVHYLPTVLSEKLLPAKLPLKEVASNSEIVRIGFVEPSLEALLSLKEVALRIDAVFKTKVAWIYCGKPLSSKEGANFLKHINCEKYKTTSITKRMGKVRSFAPDFVLLPAKETLNNKHQSSTAFLELAALNIPVIASAFHPAKTMIKDGENGLLIRDERDWLETIKYLIANEEVLQKMKKNLSTDHLKNYGFTQSYFKRINEIFINS